MAMNCKTRDELDKMLADLQASLPRMIEERSEAGDFDFEAFAGEADDIVDCAGDEDRAYVQDRLKCMLGATGVVPSDNEGEECVSSHPLAGNSA